MLRFAFLLVLLIPACAGRGDSASCEDALAHTADLAIARSAPEGDFPDADKHRAALIRATRPNFVPRCQARSGRARQKLVACILESKSSPDAHECWSR